MSSSFSSNSMCLSLGEQSSKVFILSKPSSFFAKPCRRNNKNFHVSCSNDNANKNNGDDHEKNVARRNVLVGLGGLYGASNLAPLAYASPIPIPNLKSCGKATKEGSIEVDYSCCPPTPAEWNNIPYYKFPPMSKLRRRPRAQQVTEEYIAKYQLATRRMMDLNEKDPRSFKQQANIHCAYCNGAYKFGDDVLQVHFNWLFFPFHRWYLYFYERILGKLIDDPTFALPYWNWDHPDGMRLPPMFDRRNTSLYDPRRNPHVRNGTIIDFRYGGDEEVSTDVEQTVTNNLTSVYRAMITNAACPLQFFGARYLLGTNNTDDAGTIEKMPHTPIHVWTGTVRGTALEDGRTSFGEDMGNFYSAGLDPVFYSHHANVDRMWNIWKGLGGKKRDIKEEDWLNSEFFFYDENQKPYRVRVGDCLDTRKMGYDYAPADIPWINCRPTRKGREGKVDSTKFDLENKVFPITNLNKPISFCIKRPKTSRSQEDKIEKEEVLIFKGLKYDRSKYIRFDVFLNEDENVNADELDKVEFAGTYVNLPHNHAHNNNKRDNGETFQLDITESLEDCGLEDDDIITVTVVPKKGGGAISIQSVAIEFLES